MNTVTETAELNAFYAALDADRKTRNAERLTKLAELLEGFYVTPDGRTAHTRLYPLWDIARRGGSVLTLSEYCQMRWDMAIEEYATLSEG